MRAVVVGVVFITTTTGVVVIVHVFGILLGVLVGADLVDLIHTLGLGELVDLSTDEANKGLLGESVLDRLAY